MVKGQGHTYLKPVKLLKIQIYSSFILTKGVHMPQCLHIICRLQQASRNIFMTLKLRVKVKYFLKSVLQLIIQTPHSYIDVVPKYLAQGLLMKCSLKLRFHIADGTLKSMSRSHLLKIYTAHTVSSSVIF